MATYMYTSATGTNWDDDDEDFEPSVYQEAAAQFQSAGTLTNVELALQKLESTIEDQPETTHSSPITADHLQVDYQFDVDETPTYIDHVIQHWSSDHHCRPAYVALSSEYGNVYPSHRRNYSANWKAAKLRTGGNMKNTMMMMPSPLRLSQTWTCDSMGESIEDRGCVGFSLPPLRVSTPRLCHDNDSDEERDEVFTPPDTPPMAQTSGYGADVGEYDSDSNRAVGLGLVSTKDAQLTQDITASANGASIATPSFARESSEDATVVYKQLDHGKRATSTLLGDCTPLTNTPTRAAPNLSPDLKYTHDPTSSSLVWNFAATGWFAISSLPWGRMAVAAAGALVDVVSFVARS